MIEIFCDGGCKVGTEKGAASYLFVKDGVVQFGHSTPLIKENMTNNKAEYIAVLLALGEVLEDCVVHSDSELIVKQINGEYNVKDALLISLNNGVEKHKERLMKEGIKVSFVNVPRENKYIMVCDKMNKMMMEMI